MSPHQEAGRCLTDSRETRSGDQAGGDMCEEGRAPTVETRAPTVCLKGLALSSFLPMPSHTGMVLPDI